MKTVLFFTLLSITFSLPFFKKDNNQNKKGYVIIVHGLGRTHLSMRKLTKKIEKEGYISLNFPFLTINKNIEDIENKLEKFIEKNCKNKNMKIYFVTHSLGGIIVRLYLKKHPNKKTRVVMIAPPNQGSILADKLKNNVLISTLLGPSIFELGKNPEKSVPLTLGTIDFELGIIAGTKSIYPFFSKKIPGKDDGIVSVEETKLKNMKDFIEINSSHSFIMNNEETIKQTIHFLNYGYFKK